MANVSHELRTPLTAIKGFADNLLDGIGGPVTEKQTRSLQRVKANADRLARLIGDLLDLRRIESGRLEIHPTAIKVQEVAAATIEALQPRADEKNVQIALNVNSECPAIWADRDRIAQVYTNIIGNALRFSPQGGTITVEVRAENTDRVYSAISDSGPGISPEEQERIFDRFHQVAEGTTGRTGGAGLGLAICKDLVELHGGTIGVQSVPGRGSTFYFRLPTHRSAENGAIHVEEGAHY